MFKKIMTVSLAAFTMTACSSDDSPKVASMQKKDKALSCQQVQLEINESEFYRKTAEKNKSPKIKSLLMPIGYVYTYVDAEEAIEQADQRIDYLNRIYDILNCDDPAARAASERKGHGTRFAAGTYGGYARNPVGYAPQRQQQYHSQQARGTIGRQGDDYQDEWYW